MPHQCTNCGRTFPDGSKEMLSGCPDCGGNKFQFDPSGSASGESSAAGRRERESPGSADDSGVADTVSQATRTVRDWVGRDGLGESEDPSSDDAAADATAGRDADPASDRSSAVSDTGGDSGRAHGEWPDPDHRSGRSGADRSDDDRDDSRVTASMASSEDNAQASARSDVVAPDELPDAASEPELDPGSDPEPERSDAPRAPDAGPETDPGPEAGGDRPDDSGGRIASTPSDESPDLEELRKELNEQFESIKIVRPGEYELNLMELYDRDEYIISLMEDGRYAIEVPDTWRDS